MGIGDAAVTRWNLALGEWHHAELQGEGQAGPREADRAGENAWRQDRWSTL